MNQGHAGGVFWRSAALMQLMQQQQVHNSFSTTGQRLVHSFQASRQRVPVYAL